MAIGKLEYKTCTKCGESFPATREYFYSKNKSSGVLRSECKYCSREARNKSYIREKREREKTKGRRCSKCKKYYKPVEEYFYIEDGQPGRWCIKCNEKQKQEEWIKVRTIIDEIKNQYPTGKALLIHNGNTGKWERAKVIDIFEHFMLVQTKHYRTSIAWIDILTGYTKVREG